jgi:excinuclease UvrABC nuclease subunit
MDDKPETIFENCFSLVATENTEFTETKNNNFKDLPTSAGLVLFTDSQNSPIVLLTAANIRRTVKNKLAEQIEKSKRADLKSITVKIYYSAIACKFRLAVNHYTAVRKIFTEKYKDYITLVYPWFLTVNLNDRIPFFSVTRKPTFKAGEKILGPFPSQKSAAAFQTTLEDVFALCRKHKFINNPQSCSYLQMDVCCGVCAGKINIEEYKKIIGDAFAAGAEPDAAINNFQTEMQTAAKELNFEKAAALKKKIEKLATLKKSTYRWTSDLKNLKIVHTDKSFKIKPQGEKIKKQTYAVFAMNVFQILDAGDYFKDNPAEFIDAITKNIEQLSNSPVDEMLERFAIVTYFLYRSKPSGLWLNIQNKDFSEKIKNFV